jgi:hypothetical protein
LLIDDMVFSPIGGPSTWDENDWMLVLELARELPATDG